MNMNPPGATQNHQPQAAIPGDFWHPHWDEARRRFIRWWDQRGAAIAVITPRSQPWADIPPPPSPPTPEHRWTDPDHRVLEALSILVNHEPLGAGVYWVDTNIGPGNLANFLGSEPGFAFDTVWFEPCIADPDSHPPLTFDPANKWFKVQMKLIDRALELADGRVLTCMPDLVENIDILASLRGTETFLFDLIERPAWVERCVEQINHAYFEAFDRIYNRVVTPWGGNCFSVFNIWGPGKTAKVQCDTSAMISPDMFKRFVVPGLSRQCDWLDYSMYHLDGKECIGHLDHLLGIESLNAIQFTASAGDPDESDRRWWDLYRRILAGGKSMEIMTPRHDMVIPILDHLGPNGVRIITSVPDPDTGWALHERVMSYSA